jgi:benzoyl-CoA reductase/2-hydroxyglutaryl-CoA dehydratase subunit BcrC/BadD/HgdB
LGLRYYKIGLNRVKDKLEKLTGNKITEDKLREEIESMNKMRDLFMKISLLRREGSPVISSRNYVKLHHASYYAEKTEMINILEDLYSELKDMKPQPAEGPRFLLTGSTLAMGDQKIFELLEDIPAKAVIVREEFAECIRPYSYDVGLDGDPIEELAEAYFMKRIPPAWFNPSDDTTDYLIQLTKDFNVDGVIWYQMMYRESYDMQAKYFEEKLKKTSTIPMLKLETDYDTSEKGPFKTRIETIIQIAQGG